MKSGQCLLALAHSSLSRHKILKGLGYSKSLLAVNVAAAVRDKQNPEASSMNLASRFTILSVERPASSISLSFGILMNLDWPNGPTRQTARRLKAPIIAATPQTTP